MGVSVFVAGAPLRRNNYVSFYAVKEELNGDQYRARYPVGVTALTGEHRRDKDYLIKYDSNLYMIGDHTEPKNHLGDAQYLNCTMRSSGARNIYKLVKVTINNQKMYVAKITARAVNVGQHLFTPYGKDLLIPTHALSQSCPPSLVPKTAVHVLHPAIQPSSIPISDESDCEMMPHTTTLMTKHYGYSTDSLWEITMSLEGDRESRRNHISHMVTRPPWRRRQRRIY